jgi:glycerol-3-phosphate dehydrogenase
MPIAAMVASILSGRTTPADAVRNLMTRALKEERG